MGIFGMFNRRRKISSSKYARLAVEALNNGRGLISIDIAPMTEIVCDKCGSGAYEGSWQYISDDYKTFKLRCPNCYDVIVEQK